ncbi:MAG: PmoA family protein [Chitinophagaceae bacterium]
MYKIVAVLLLVGLNVLVFGQGGKGFVIIEKKNQKQVDILFNNKLLTSYCYYDSIRKPILFPINTTDGVTVTRGYPIAPRPGDQTDHPHHTGMWLNYESVNGLDYWNNSTSIPLGKRNLYGTIVHNKIVQKKSSGNRASLTTEASWVDPANRTVLKEKTIYYFMVTGTNFIIDRFTTLTATDTAVLFKDVKDGFFAIRVASELELTSKEPSTYLDDKGNSTTVMNSVGSGMYYSSNGLRGDSVWGTKGKWVMLTGRKDNTDITIGIIDHPKNIGYPAYWHARGYGLFSVNPLGRKIFSNGKEELNFSLKAKESVTFRYRVVIHSGQKLNNIEMNALAAEFDLVN